MGVREARRYTAEQRREAVEEAGRVGSAAAAKRLGIPTGTLS